MSFFSIFDKPKKAASTPTPIKVVEMCPFGDHEFIKIEKDDGIYCNECGQKHSDYIATVEEAHRDFDESLKPTYYFYVCPRCLHRNHKFDYKKKYGSSVLVSVCVNCKAILQSPMGFCVTCWDKLAKNGRCINHECGRYQKNEEPRLIPIYQADVTSPHCGSCGQPYIIYNKEVGNKKTAEVALGPGGYEWISAKKGCSQCGAAFEKAKKTKLK